MVEADVAGEEAQHARQLEVRAPGERGVVVPPVGMRLPVRVLVLVLHVEEPDADGAGDDDDRALHEEVVLPADRQAGPGDDEREQEVGQVHAPANARLRPAGHEARVVDEDEEPAEAEHDERVAVQPVLDLPRPRERLVLGDRQRGDVADAAPVEIPRRRVMDGVLVLPAAVRQPDEQAGHDADRVVRAARAHERTVCAVVEDDERARQEAGCGQDKRQGEPDRHTQRERRRDEQREIRHDRGGEIEHAPAEPRLRIRVEDAPPRARRIGVARGKG